MSERNLQGKQSKKTKKADSLGLLPIVANFKSKPIIRQEYNQK